MSLSLNSLARYFDLGSEVRPLRDQRAKSRSDGSTEVKIHWLPQYLALLSGIGVQPFFQRYMAIGDWKTQGIWGWLLASVIIAAMAFPGVYKQSFDPLKPILVQFCLIFTAGTGWQTLVTAAFKAAGVVAR